MNKVLGGLKDEATMTINKGHTKPNIESLKADESQVLYKAKKN